MLKVVAMSQDYVRLKAREALSATGGNRREAGQLLRVWSETDPDLKKALVAPFLGNLCALAVQRAASTGAARQPRAAAAQDDSKALLSTIGSNLAQTMSTTRQNQAPPPRSSARHRQAVATLAAAYKKKD